MGTIISRKETDDFEIPAECRFKAFDETEFCLYFSDKFEAIHHARLNECKVIDLQTDEVVINTLREE